MSTHKINKIPASHFLFKITCLANRKIKFLLVQRRQQTKITNNDFKVAFIVKKVNSSSDCSHLIIIYCKNTIIFFEKNNKFLDSFGYQFA